MRRPLVVVLALTLLLVLGACSGAKVTRVLSASDTAKQISAQLGDISGGAPPKVRCPTGIKAIPGRMFDCTTSLEDQPLTIHVTVDGSDGRFTPRATAAVVSVPRVVHAIQSGLPKNGASTTISCGRHSVLVVQPGATFSCSAITGTVTSLVQVTVLDLDGRFRYQAAGATGAGG
jgi:hypothetical protein